MKSYLKLKDRYGRGYISALLGIAFITTFFIPIPGITLVSLALIVGMAEVYRALFRKGSFPEAGIDLAAEEKHCR